MGPHRTHLEIEEAPLTRAKSTLFRRRDLRQTGSAATEEVQQQIAAAKHHLMMSDRLCVGWPTPQQAPIAWKAGKGTAWANEFSPT
jgi:hypothetical protein